MSSKLYWLGCYAFVCTGISAGVIGPSLATLSKQTNASIETLGILFTSLSFGYLISAPIISTLGKKLGIRKTLIFSPLLNIVAMVLFVFSQNLVLLMCANVVLGIGQSGTQVSYNAMFGGGEKASKKLNQMNAFFGLGALLAPLLASLGYAQFGAATLAFVVAGVLCVPLSAGAFLWKQSERAANRQESLPSNPAFPNTATSPFRTSVLWFMLVVMGLYVGVEVAFSGWVTEFTRRSTGIALAQAAASTSIFWVALAISRYFTSTVLRIRPSLLVIWMVLLTLMGYGLILIAGFSLPAMLIGVFCVGFGMAPIFPTLVALAIQQFPKHATLVTSLLTSVGSLGAFFLPVVTGNILVQSIRNALLLQVAICIAILAFWALAKQTLDRDKHGVGG